MIQILKKQKEEIENEIPIEDLLKNKFEDLGLVEDENEEFENIEEILNSMTEEEKRLFEEAIKDNSIVDDIKSKLKPWVRVYFDFETFEVTYRCFQVIFLRGI